MNSELSHDSSAVRKQLVNSAVMFLNNPRMKQHSQKDVTKFLKSKGLTDEEISTAVAEAAFQGPRNIYEAPLPVPARNPYEPSLFTYSRAGLPFFLIVSGLVYGFSHLYQNYLEPFLTGKPKKDPLQKIISVQKTLLDAIQNQQKSIGELTIVAKETRDLMKDLITKETALDAGSKKKLEDILSSVIAIRNMSLSRKSFKAIPSAPSLPDWQVLSATIKSNAELSTSKELSNNEVPSSDMINDSSKVDASVRSEADI